MHNLELYVATPITRDYPPLHVASLMFMHKPEGGMIWDYLPNAPIDVARNILAERAKKQTPYILFADSDATWHFEAIMRLMERDLPVVTGCIYRRAIPPVPTFGTYKGIDKDDHHLYDFGYAIEAILEHTEKMGVTNESENELCLDKTDKDLLPIDGTGLHFILIKTEVFEQLEPPYFRCTSPGAGEDFYFCRKLKEAGIPIYADLSVHSGHIVGVGMVFGIKEFLTFYGKEKLIRYKEIWDVGIRV